MIVSVMKFNPAAPIQGEPWDERKRKGWVSIGQVQYDRNGALPFKGRLDKKAYWMIESKAAATVARLKDADGTYE